MDDCGRFMRQIEEGAKYKASQEKPNEPREPRRKPARVPRFINVLTNVLVVGVLSLSAAYSLTTGGELQRPGSPYKVALDDVSGLFGLSAQEITISGLQNLRAEHVYSAINMHKGASLIGFDAVWARARLAKLDWVVEASVQRLFPNRLLIEVKERQPYAVWQEKGQFRVIDESGKIINTLSPKKWSHLPLVAGVGARQTAAELVNQLEEHSSLRLLFRAAARVADRRWTLYLANDVKVLLPARDVPQALQRLVELENKHGILGRDIVSIDLRLDDRIVLKLSDGAAKEVRRKRGKAKS